MIELDRLSKSFGGRAALADLSARVAPGEVVALVGPNGAGKSTALRILAGILRPDRGSARIAGHDIVRESLEARKHLAYLPQRLGVPASTVLWDLALLVCRVRGLPLEAAETALESAGLLPRAGASLGELSGGQRQRAMLALATMGRVDALLLDEPSINLDAEGSEEVRATIREARDRGVAVLFASHHLYDVAALADRIVVLVDGRAVVQGALPDLARAAGVPWTEASAEAPIERIYRVLVARGRAGAAELRLIRGDAA
ncbi:MAG TPA: ABC transporter ATP-binding protein [Gemmatimonadales bacterium]|nr:ABC transporter ATP-binding protein [Gemmatimonadales bacterium]